MANKLNNNDLFIRLREQYPVFTYSGYNYKIIKQELRIEFDFNISGIYYFRPVYHIKLRENIPLKPLPDKIMKSLVFHIGLIEMASYWKATCSPTLFIQAGKLSPDQLEFFKKVFYYGLGEFRYLNNIEITQDAFLNLVCDGAEDHGRFDLKTEDAYIVPVGGGKDSVVSLELLQDSGRKLIPFVMNPSSAMKDTIHHTGLHHKDMIVFDRHLDKKLLELNDKGFLNGHTPFSALLAFNTLLAAALSRSGWIALSNESSASEPTIPGTHINHQYSKSIEFENDFRKYCADFLTTDITYFSFLRPVNELQIAALFSEFPSHFHSFKSCNVGSKENRWCGSCPKCLFVFIMLRPFIEEHILTGVFGKDLLDDPGLIEIFDELIGISAIKPFECIGTVEEVNIALCRVIDRNKRETLPFLLSYYKGLNNYGEYRKGRFRKALSDISGHHNVDQNILQILKNRLKNFKNGDDA